MKKSLLAVLLAVAMVAPAFAAKGDMYIDGKLGIGVSNSAKWTGGEHMSSDTYYGFKAKTPFSLGAEFFYGLMDNLSVGFGANYILDSETNYEELKVKAGTTNIYVAVKPEVKIESNIFSSIYAVGQLGLAMVRMDVSEEDWVNSIDNGIYLGAGLGVTIKDVVFVEFIFSSSNGSGKYEGQTIDVQYTATTFNIGYKFAL